LNIKSIKGIKDEIVQEDNLKESALSLFDLSQHKKMEKKSSMAQIIFEEGMKK
jgi:hypothetical protein